jgi:hypothetical protein
MVVAVFENGPSSRARQSPHNASLLTAQARTDLAPHVRTTSTVARMHACMPTSVPACAWIRSHTRQYIRLQ